MPPRKPRFITEIVKRLDAISRQIKSGDVPPNETIEQLQDLAAHVNTFDARKITNEELDPSAKPRKK